MIQNFLEYMEYIVLVNSYWTDCTQIKGSLLGIEISYTLFVTGNTEDGLLCLFHYIRNYGLICCGNSSHSAGILKIQKNIIITLTWCKSRDSYRDLYKHLKILPLHIPSSLLLSVVNKKNKFKLNSDVCNINTRQKHNFHQP
jgi:hypothetical protein